MVSYSGHVEPTIRQRLASGLRIIAAELDAQRAAGNEREASAEARHTAQMAKLDAILSHMPGVMRSIETLTADVESLKQPRVVALNGKGSHS